MYHEKNLLHDHTDFIVTVSAGFSKADGAGYGSRTAFVVQKRRSHAAPFLHDFLYYNPEQPVSFRFSKDTEGSARAGPAQAGSALSSVPGTDLRFSHWSQAHWGYVCPGHLSGKTATRLCAMSNHFGPAFVVNYIGLAQLHSPQAVPLLLVCIYAPPLILGSIWMAGVKEPAFRHEKPASRSQINFKIIDAGIINGFETMLRIAGYIVIFSILSGALDQLPLSAPLFKAVGTGILEVTTGSEAVASSCADFTRKLVLICAMVSFGGFCGIFQTKAIMKNTPFRLSEYILFKFLCSAGSALLAVLLVYLFF